MPTRWTSTHSDPVLEFAAQYSDGRSAAISTVSVRPEETALVLVGQGGRIVDRWPWPELRLTEKATAGRPLRLSNRSKEGARLTVADQSILPLLEERAPHLHREPMTKARLWATGGIIGVCAAVVAFFIFGLPLIAKPVAALIPVSWEEEVGKQTIDIVNRLFAGGRAACDSAGGVKALNRLAQRLTKGVETPYTIRVSVADSPIVNAFAVPGGRVVLFRGLIEKADNPEEVAGVLAHELAHVVYRHPTQGLVTSVGWSALLSAVTGGASVSNEVLARLAAHLATSANTRDLESEADAKGVDMLNQAGVGGDGLVGFFKKLQGLEAKSGLKIPEYLSSHPLTTNRIAEIKGLPRKASGSALTETEWQAVKNICG